MEVDDRGVHNLYRPLVSSGLAFGAKRWVFTLDRQCERLASAMATTLSPDIATSAGNQIVLESILYNRQTSPLLLSYFEMPCVTTHLFVLVSRVVYILVYAF